MATTQNIFGLEMPTIYVDGIAYQLPKASKGNRQETFDKEFKEWVDLDNVIHERVKGYRLNAEWSWDHLTETEINDLISIYNAAKDSIDIKIGFSTFPRRYRIRITNFSKGLSGGYGYRDSAEMSVQGITLLDQFPNPDLFYSIAPQLGYGCIFPG